MAKHSKYMVADPEEMLGLLPEEGIEFFALPLVLDGDKLRLSPEVSLSSGQFNFVGLPRLLEGNWVIVAWRARWINVVIVPIFKDGRWSQVRIYSPELADAARAAYSAEDFFIGPELIGRLAS